MHLMETALVELVAFPTAAPMHPRHCRLLPNQLSYSGLSYPCFSLFVYRRKYTIGTRKGLSKCGAYIATAECCRLHTDG